VTDVLYIAAKAPRPGYAKTRLAAGIGAAAAIALYSAFLRDIAARFSGAPFEVGWYFTPDDGWEEIETLLPSPESAARRLAQGNGDWTQRQSELFRGAAERLERKVLLVGSDSPQLRIETVEAAFESLDRHDVVFGPTPDGGYYLIGMNGWHDVLSGVEMSTGAELAEILRRARADGVSIDLVEPEYDVDIAADLAPLRADVAVRPDLAHTRAALERLGLLDE